MEKLRKQQGQEAPHVSGGFFRLPDSPVQQRNERISTGSKLLDDLLDGGLEVGQITQFYEDLEPGKHTFVIHCA